MSSIETVALLAWACVAAEACPGGLQVNERVDCRLWYSRPGRVQWNLQLMHQTCVINEQYVTLRLRQTKRRSQEVGRGLDACSRFDVSRLLPTNYGLESQKASTQQAKV